MLLLLEKFCSRGWIGLLVGWVVSWRCGAGAEIGDVAVNMV